MATTAHAPRHVDDLRGLVSGRDTSGLRERLRRALEHDDVRLAVIDDDPTGTQTVSGVPLVTGWEEGELEWAMRAARPTFAVLTNSRALPEHRAVEINATIGARLAAIAARLGVSLRCISRSDSTLRGHFPAEVEALAAGLGRGGLTTDLVLVCPAFPEAGRVTFDDVHWVLRGEELVPAGDTEFARDGAFGYRSSDLREWVRERAGTGATVASLPLGDLRRGGPEGACERLLSLRGRARYVTVNAVEQADLDALALGVHLAEASGLRTICRTGPSFLSARAGMATATPLARLPASDGSGLLVVGSHTALTTAQLAAARASHDLAEVTLDVAEILASRHDHEIARATEALTAALAHGDAALVTSRELHAGAGAAASLDVSARVADALVAIVAGLPAAMRLAWLVAKGGITSHDLATRALAVRRATVRGQLFHGKVSVWELGEGSTRPGLRYVVFPGNVGDEQTLARTLDRLKGRA
jgi:uncharacterized protein YgbK (DUF1537 family)